MAFFILLFFVCTLCLLLVKDSFSMFFQCFSMLLVKDSFSMFVKGDCMCVCVAI